MLQERPEVYAVTLKTLSPLHIGTGDILRRDYDFAVHQGKTWVINPDALAETLYDYNEFQEMVNGAPLSDLLVPKDFQDGSPLFRYVCAGEPKAQAKNTEVREQIKDVWDQPYIPGSSLKGALRTALFCALFEVQKKTWSVSMLRPAAKSAAQPLEDDALGRTPNTDLLRALQVSDSTPDSARRLQILNLVATKTDDASDKAPPISLEAIPEDVEFTVNISFDTYLLKHGARELGWNDDQTKWLKRLPRVLNGWTLRRLSEEESRLRAGEWKRQFKEIVRRVQDEKQCILQLGWGGGWDSKTLGSYLTSNPAEFKELVDTFRLQRKGKFQQGDRFPKTRRVFLGGVPERVRGELGWVQLTWERVQ
jgi:CRISPR-associated protein Csm5